LEKRRSSKLTAGQGRKRDGKITCRTQKPKEAVLWGKKKYNKKIKNREAKKGQKKKKVVWAKLESGPVFHFLRCLEWGKQTMES